MRVAVIGANGFIARHVNQCLAAAGHEVIGILRRRSIAELAGVTELRYLDDAGAGTVWDPLIAGADAIVHLVSPPDGKGEQHAAASRSISAGVLGLARAAAASGVKRLVFVSTVKVNGESSSAEPFRPGSDPKPETIYGIVKLETETGLAAISAELELPITIARPAAVYGDGDAGNIRLLAKLLSAVPGRLVPFGAIDNRRSFIHVENLASALVRCAEDDSGANRLFLLHDGAPVSTSALCRDILAALGKPTTLAGDPFGIVRAVTHLAAPGVARRLYGSLEIDDNGIQEVLGWTPPIPAAEGFRRAMTLRRGNP
jgi:nucleoside-diphosphate-sugar epimerase